MLLILYLCLMASLRELVFLSQQLLAIRVDQQVLVFLQAQRLVIFSPLLAETQVILSLVNSLFSATATVKELILAKKGDLKAIQTLVLAFVLLTPFLVAHNLES